MMKYKNKLILVFSVFFINYFLDRITKLLAIEYLKDNRDYRFLWDTVVLTFMENKGAFLGAGSEFPEFLKLTLFIIFPLVVCLLGLLYCIFMEKDKISVIIIVTIIAGGLANIQDRIFNDGKVTDFLNFGIGNLRTGVLNVADMSITFGAIALILYEIYKTKLENSENNGNN